MRHTLEDPHHLVIHTDRARQSEDVIARVDGTARVNYLSPNENAELLNWDAEKYRQQLNREGATLQ